MSKRILCHFMEPFGSVCYLEEKLQFAMTCTSFDFPTTLLFSQAAILQLRKENAYKTFEILSLYDIDTLWVDERSLALYQVKKEELISTVSVLEPQMLEAWINEHDIIFRF